MSGLPLFTGAYLSQLSVKMFKVLSKYAHIVVIDCVKFLADSVDKQRRYLKIKKLCHFFWPTLYVYAASGSLTGLGPQAYYAQIDFTVLSFVLL